MKVCTLVFFGTHHYRVCSRLRTVQTAFSYALENQSIRVTGFMGTLAVLLWSGTGSELSPRGGCPRALRDRVAPQMRVEQPRRPEKEAAPHHEMPRRQESGRALEHPWALMNPGHSCSSDCGTFSFPVPQSFSLQNEWMKCSGRFFSAPWAVMQAIPLWESGQPAPRGEAEAAASVCGCNHRSYTAGGLPWGVA